VWFPIRISSAFGLVQIMGPIYRTHVLLTTNPEGFSGNLRKRPRANPDKIEQSFKRLEQGLYIMDNVTLQHRLFYLMDILVFYDGI